jgi:hypothetical protein
VGLCARRAARGDRVVVILCWWVVAIGIGSGLFHTFANRLTMLADVIPIAVFTLAYTGFAIRRYLGYSARHGGDLPGFYLAAGGLTGWCPSG